MTSHQKQAQTTAAYSWIPAADDVLSPPPLPIPTEAPPAQTLEAGLGLVVTIANVLVTAVIITAMLVDGQQAGKAILFGAAYFALTTAGIALITTGSLTSMFAVWQRERTERERIAAYADAAELVLRWRLTGEQNRALELQAAAPSRQLPADPPQTSYQGSTFVPPYEDPHSTATEALQWARSLYGQDGQPDPAKVQTDGDKAGWLRVRAIGSKRGGGSEDAALWLRQRKFLRRVPGGYRVNLDRYPTRASLQMLR